MFVKYMSYAKDIRTPPTQYKAFPRRSWNTDLSVVRTSFTHMRIGDYPIDCVKLLNNRRTGITTDFFRKNKLDIKGIQHSTYNSIIEHVEKVIADKSIKRKHKAIVSQHHSE